MSTYTGTTIKDLSITTPTEGATPPSEVNDAIREIKTVYKNQEAIIAKTGAYTLTASDSMVTCNGTFTITLPQASTVSSATFRKRYIIKNIGTGNITVDGYSAETIDGAATVALALQYSTLIIEADGTSWHTITNSNTILDPELLAIAGLTSAADKLPYFTGSGTASLADLTAFARSILDDANEATFKATVNLEIGTDVQASDATLTSIALLGTAADKMLYSIGIDTWAEAAITAAGRALLDDANAAAQIATLGLDADIATLSLPASTTISAFGATLTDDADALTARATLGLGTLATQSGTFSGTSSGTNTGDQTITLTGDVTGSGTGSFAVTIANGAVSLAKMADMATASLIGRNTAGTGVPEVLSASTVRSLLSLVIGTNVQAYDADLTTWAGVTPGTGVGTALAVAVGSAGAILVNGGVLGTPSSGTLTYATGLPISTGISGLGTGIATFLATPSSANLASALTTKTGTGLVVLDTSPTIANPVITNIAPAANFTLTQNSVVPFTSVNTGAVANTLYLNAGNVGIGTTGPAVKLDVLGAVDGNQVAIFTNSDADNGYGVLINAGDDNNVSSLWIRNYSGGTDLFKVGGAGQVYMSGNVGIGTTDQFGSGAKVIGIANATTNPTTNPTLGFVLYGSSGNPYFRTSAGTTIGLDQSLLTTASPTFAGLVVPNIAPAANLTLTQNSVAVMTSVAASAVVNTLYLKAGKVGIRTIDPLGGLQINGVGYGTDITFAAADLDGTHKVKIYDNGNVYLASLTASELIATDASKNLVSLAVATYPSLTELAYLKGLNQTLLTTASPTFAAVTLSNGQVVFPATQNPSANVNTLDDYEEGTFTPTIIGSTTAGAGTYTTQSGEYTKIGNRVFFYLKVVWTAHDGTGNMRFGGLPYTANAGYSNIVAICTEDMSLVGGIFGQISGGNTYGEVKATTATSFDNVAMDSAASIYVSGSYIV